MGAPPPQNQDRHCEFHKDNGHHMKGCIPLRLLIEKFIKNCMLVHFLGDQRGAVVNRKNYVREVSTETLEIIDNKSDTKVEVQQ